MTSDSDHEPPASQPGDETDGTMAEAGEPARADLERENADLRDRLLRTAAEMENFRKRAERELREARAWAIAGFARDMLGATDNLSRALAALPETERQAADEAVKALIEGVELTEREMLRLMEKNGVSKLDPRGEKFDPHFHQAMFEVPNTDVPENTVVEVVQPGYVIGERMLRPALVGVAKGGPKRAPSGGDETETAAAAGTAASRPGETGEAGGVDKSV